MSSTTPNAEKVNRNTIDAAAAIGGPSNGSVTSLNSAESVSTEHPRRVGRGWGSRLDQKPPTVRTITATLKNTSATSSGAMPAATRGTRARRPDGTARGTRCATTTVGNTNGTVTKARNTERPGNS